jgi:hypothetical protein
MIGHFELLAGLEILALCVDAPEIVAVVLPAAAGERAVIGLHLKQTSFSSGSG